MKVVTKSRLWQISLTTTAEAEEAGIEALSSEFGVPASGYTDFETKTVLVSVYLETKPAQLAQRLNAIRARLRAAKAGGLLAAARRQADTPQLQAEATAFALVRAWLRFCAFRLKLYADIAATPPRPEAQAHWTAAYQSYDQILDWADLHLTPLFRDNLKALHTAMWELRLRRIQADHFTSPWLRWRIDAGTGIRLAVRFLHVYGGYKRAKG